MRAITYDPRAHQHAATRALRAHVQRVAKPADYRANAAEVGRLALWLFPAALVFVTVLGV